MYFLLVSLTLFSCKDDEVDIVNLRINYHQQSAVGVAPTLVLLTQEGDKIGTEDWKYHYSGIKGFDYEWGYVYDLIIRKKQIKNPLADGSSVEYIFDKLISKIPADENDSFDLILKSKNKGIVPAVIIGDAAAGFVLMDEQEIDCSSFCEALSQLLTEENEVIGSFKFNSSNQPILLTLKSE